MMRIFSLLLLSTVLASLACGDGTSPTPRSRTFLMGVFGERHYGKGY
jgi:hypothetical protein